jgi:hypothetical protein
MHHASCSDPWGSERLVYLALLYDHSHAAGLYARYSLRSRSQHTLSTPVIISLVRYLENIPKTTVFEREKAGALWIIPTAFSLANMLFYGTADNS